MNPQTNNRRIVLKYQNDQRSVLQRSLSIGASGLIPQVSASNPGLQPLLPPQGRTVAHQGTHFLPYQTGQHRVRRCNSEAAVILVPPPRATIGHVVSPLATTTTHVVSRLVTTNSHVVSPLATTTAHVVSPLATTTAHVVSRLVTTNSHVLKTFHVNDSSPVKIITNNNGIIPSTVTPIAHSQMFNQEISLRNITIRPRPSAKPKYVVISNKKVLCKNCGIMTQDANICRRCSFSMSNTSTINNQGNNVRRRLNAERPKLEQNCSKGLPASSFYNGTSDFTRYLKETTTCANKKPVTTKSSQILGKRPKPTENVCITISSDSEDESTSTSASTTPSYSQNSSTEIAETPNKILRQDSIQGTPIKVKTCGGQRSTFEFPISPETSPWKPQTKTDEELLISTLNLTIDSIRLGQMKLIPKCKSFMRISNESLSIPVHCEATNMDAILDIKWLHVSQCDICIEPLEPCLFLRLNQGFLPQLRESLSMEKGKHPYYDPSGEDDEKLFIIYINSDSLFKTSSQCNPVSLLRKIDLIRKKMKKHSTYFMKISYEESEMRQNMAAIALKVSVATSQSPLVAVQSTEGNQIITRHNTRQSTAVVSEVEDVKTVFKGPRIELFVFPPPPETGGISVTNEDKFCLNESEFLNDVIIEFYLKYVYNTILSKVDRNRTHIFSCFFYERLMQKNIRDKKGKDISPAERRHSQVKKWTRNVDIFSKDFIFVPINESAHWYLAVICFAGVDFDEYESITNVTPQEKNIEKLDATEVMKQVTQESKHDIVDKVQGSQGQSSNSQDEQRSNVCNPQGQDVEEMKDQSLSQLTHEGQSSSQPSHEGQNSLQLTHKGQNSNVKSLSSNIIQPPKKRKLLSIDLPNFHLRKKLCQSKNQSFSDADGICDVEGVKNAQNRLHDENENLKLKSTNEGSDSIQICSEMINEQPMETSENNNSISFVNKTSENFGQNNSISGQKNIVFEPKFNKENSTETAKPENSVSEVVCHNTDKIDETIILVSDNSQLSDNDSFLSIISHKKYNFGANVNPKQLGSDDSCEIVTSSDESVCGLEISNIHTVDTNLKSDSSENESTETKLKNQESFCDEKMIIVPPSDENLLKADELSKNCSCGEVSNTVNIKQSINLQICQTSLTQTGMDLKDSDSSPTKCLNNQISNNVKLNLNSLQVLIKDCAPNSTECCNDQFVEPSCKNSDSNKLESSKPQTAALSSTECLVNSALSSTKCEDHTIDVNANNDSIIELYVAPGNTNFTLSKALEKKCFISPHKTPLVQISRISINSFDSNAPIKLSSSTSLSSDDSVIILSSPDDVESIVKTQTSLARKSLLKNESFFEFKEVKCKDEEGHGSKINCKDNVEQRNPKSDQEFEVHHGKVENVFKDEDFPKNNAQGKALDLSEYEPSSGNTKVENHSQDETPCGDENTKSQLQTMSSSGNAEFENQLKSETLSGNEMSENQSQPIPSHDNENIVDQLQTMPSSDDKQNIRILSTDSTTAETSLHLYLETSSNNLSTFEPMTSPDLQSSESLITNTTSGPPGTNIFASENPGQRSDQGAVSEAGSAGSCETETTESASSSEAKTAETAGSCEGKVDESADSSEAKATEKTEKTFNNNQPLTNDQNGSKISSSSEEGGQTTLLVGNSINESGHCSNDKDIPDKMEVNEDGIATQTNTVKNDPTSETNNNTVLKRPCILIFDSLRGPTRSKTATNLREYLTMEWNTRKKETNGDKKFDKYTMKMSSVVVPQQDNYTDCGLFLLHYVEKFFSSPLHNYTPPVKLTNWFEPEECKTKRSHIKEIIDELHEGWKK